MEKICGIYMIKNQINNKVYIGQSTDIKSRWAFEHKIRPNKYFDNAWKKYGEEAFEFSILKECKKEEQLCLWVEIPKRVIKINCLFKMKVVKIK